MAKATPSPILQALRGLAEDRAVSGLPDRELLRRLVAGRDEAAFGAVVRRHGPAVLGVCRALLADPHDAEDAFQATFLVLARRARSIRATASLGSWLHGVAYRTAMRARTEFAKRKRHEALAASRGVAEAADELAWRDVRAAVHRELNAVPERLRAPLVLCYLEGRTQDEAALQLGLPLGTLRGRLERGRALLRRRLARLGLGPAAVLVAAAWPEAGAAAVPPTLADSTASAAAGSAAGQAVSGLVTPKVATLAEGVMRAMVMTRLKVASAVLLVLGVLGAGAAAFLQATAAAQGDPVAHARQTAGGPDRALPKGHAEAPPPPRPGGAAADQPAAGDKVGPGGDTRPADDRPAEAERARLEETGPALVKEFVATLRKRYGEQDAGELRRFIDPAYLKEHKLEEGRFPVATVVTGVIYDNQVTDDPRTAVIVARTQDAEKEAFVFRLVVREGKVYLRPLAPPDPKTGSFRPWILRLKL